MEKKIKSEIENMLTIIVQAANFWNGNTFGSIQML